MVQTASGTTFRILNPTSVIAEVERVEREPITSLNGAVLGVLSNGFGGHDLPGGIAERLAEMVEFADVVRYVKPSISRPADDATVSELASRAEVALVGLCA